MPFASSRRTRTLRISWGSHIVFTQWESPHQCPADYRHRPRETSHRNANPITLTRWFVNKTAIREIEEDQRPSSCSATCTHPCLACTTQLMPILIYVLKRWVPPQIVDLLCVHISNFKTLKDNINLSSYFRS